MSTSTAQTTKGGGRELDSRGQVVVITGASSGLGLETAKQMAAQGAEMVMVCRSRTRGEQAQAEVARVATGNAPVLVLGDLSIQADVRRVAAEIRERYDHVDVLVNNAGGASGTRELTPDGIEQTWATNHLAPFLLTHELLPLLIAAGGRVVVVASEIYSKRIDLGNLQGERKYSFFGSYRISKLGNVMFARQLAKRLERTGVTALSVSPGPAKTNFGGDGPGGVVGAITSVMRRSPIFRPADQAAAGIVWAATAPELRGAAGGLYMRRRELKLKGAAADPELAARLWTISEQQTAIDPAGSTVAAASLPTG